ncbi:MAG: CRTAC1 family protein [Acidobacteria bacterium]|nr:CRTAC1 family protein [Acidobacteriota bacterium]
MRDFRVSVVLGLALLSGCGGKAEAPSPPPAAKPAVSSLPTFTDVTAEAGIRFTHNNGAFGKKYLPETMGSGCAFLDADGDGKLDIYLVNGADWPSHHQKATYPALYRNLGGGKFEEITAAAGLKQELFGMGVAVGDYDNDGHDDLFVTALGPARLYHNRGDGKFEEVAAAAGVARAGFGSSAAFLDYDRDGDLDLLAGYYVEWSQANDLTCTIDGTSKSYCTPESYKGEGPRLYRNDGNGHFTDVSKASGIENLTGKSLGLAVLDFDGDGWPDVAIANDTQPNYLYRNNHDGTFKEVGRESGIAFSETGVARGAMGIDAADYDGSGRESLVVGNFSNEMLALYHNEGSGLFIDDAPRAGIGQPSLLTLAFGAFFFDYDLDGHPDIFIANGHVEDDINRLQKEVTYAQKPHLFRNTGTGTFEPVGERSGEALAVPMVARGAAYGDYDGDGDLDILVTANGGPARLLRNDGGNASSWLRVRLRGTKSNRDGIGATVRVTAGGRTQSGYVRSGSSYESASELAVTFGFGPGVPRVDTIDIVWPSGASQQIKDVATGRAIVIDETAGIVP